MSANNQEGKAGSTIAVFGAAGHTGRFVLQDLRARGLRTRAIARDAAALGGLGADEHVHAGADGVRAAIAGCALVVNCAGPFAETAPAVFAAGRAEGAHVVDVTGEALVAIDSFAQQGAVFGAGPLVAAPAFGFFGALGDLLVTAALGDWPDAASVTLAFALDGWVPTRGTRLAGARRAGRRVVFRDGRLAVLDGKTPPPALEWTFGEPFGRQTALGEFTTVDVVTLAHHLRCQRIDALINEAPLLDLRSERTGPVAADASGRSAQQFLVEVVVEREGRTRRASASGRDIYAITAPLVGEAVERILAGRLLRHGLGAAGELFDARDFLRALAPVLRVELIV
jgi:hypothetical protein